jgi:glycosyltransferase involved in cell wall biosynthesis
MAKNKARKAVFISSFKPRKCGIATFTADLIDNIAAIAKHHFDPLVVAMRASDSLTFSEPVKFEIRQEVKSDYITAADYINFSHVDVVSVQHEFGLFGGPAGAYLNLLLSRLNAPVITTVHTVLDDPAPDYYQALVDVCNCSYEVVTMNERGIRMLRDIYAIPEQKIKLIPHGIPDLAFVDSNYYKHKFGMDGRKTILTFGLLSKNKGIETMIQAMTEIIKVEPAALYVVLGMTHPSVLRHDGESYRFGLQRMVKELGLTENVIFHNRFVDEQELHNFLCAADIYVTPYVNREQLTSGTLSFAVGAGKAVVSTPYWAAEELLADGRGIIVPFADHSKMAVEIIRALKDESLFHSLRRKAYDYGRSRTWPKAAQAYWKLFNAKTLPIRAIAKPIDAPLEPALDMHVPEPSLTHVKRLTDDTGMYQHARFTVPNRNLGYTTDDNARAVIAMTKYYSQYSDPEALKLFDTYLSFILYAQDGTGHVRNLMDFDRKWAKSEPPHDGLGRTLWALGTVMASPPAPTYLSIAKDAFDKIVNNVPTQYIRAMAYAILGTNDYLRQFPGASEIKRCMTVIADKLLAQYNNYSLPDWQWFEPILTYDNAVLPLAMFVAGRTLSDKYLTVARKTCAFLLEQTFDGDHFSFVGCHGWFERGQKKAKWDQQPIEACSTVMMLDQAYEITKEKQYRQMQRKAFDWLLGANDLAVPLYSFTTKGCHDGLTPTGVNLNQGAESMLSFLLALLTIIESYAVAEKVVTPLVQTPVIPAKKNLAIEEVKSAPARRGLQESQSPTLTQ